VVDFPRSFKKDEKYDKVETARSGSSQSNYLFDPTTDMHSKLPPKGMVIGGNIKL
jgi:hypothetical protein